MKSKRQTPKRGGQLTTGRGQQPDSDESVQSGKTVDYLWKTLPRFLPEFLVKQRWFGGKAQPIRSVRVADIVPVSGGAALAVYVVLVRVIYKAAKPETYALTLKWMLSGEKLPRSTKERPLPMLRLPGHGGRDVVVIDALWDANFALLLLEAIRGGRVFKGKTGKVEAAPTRAFERVMRRNQKGANLTPSLVKSEQSNTSIIYGRRFILKFFRRLGEGINPEVELGTFLTQRSSFTHVPPGAGSINYRRARKQPASMAFLQGFVANQGDAWTCTLQALDRYFRRILSRRKGQAPELPRRSLLSLAEDEVPETARELVGAYLGSARLLGERTAELHLALASDRRDPSLAPECFSLAYQRTIYRHMCTLADSALNLLKDSLQKLSGLERERAEKVLAAKDRIQEDFDRVLHHHISGVRIRVHGDYHLGQVLCTNGDFVIIDFEGEPTRPMKERRVKRSPLHDVSGMLRSFHYAAESAVLGRGASGLAGSRDPRAFKPWADYWRFYVSAAFLREYVARAGRDSLLPSNRQDMEILLQAYLLEKATYELKYELNNRPHWVSVPLDGILQIVRTQV